MVSEMSPLKPTTEAELIFMFLHDAIFGSKLLYINTTVISPNFDNMYALSP